MKFNDVVYSITFGEAIIQCIRRDPRFIEQFLKGNITGSMDIELAPASMNLKREDLKEIIATLRVMGKI